MASAFESASMRIVIRIPAQKVAETEQAYTAGQITVVIHVHGNKSNDERMHPDTVINSGNCLAELGTAIRRIRDKYTA